MTLGSHPNKATTSTLYSCYGLLWGQLIVVAPPSLHLLSGLFSTSSRPPPQRPPVPDVSPHQLPETSGEQDICGHILSVRVRMQQPFVRETRTERVLYAAEPRPQPAAVEQVAFRTHAEEYGQQGEEELAVGERGGLSLVEVSEAEETQAHLGGGVFSSAEVWKGVMSETLRAKDCIER